LHQAHQVHRSVNTVQGLLGQAKFFQQTGSHVGRGLIAHFKTNRITKMPLRQFTLQSHTQVGNLFFIHIQIAVAGYAKLVHPMHFHTWK